MASKPGPAYRRLAEEDRRQTLIEATIATLSEFGLEGTTVRRIAAGAGVTPGLVRHYFSGKEALVSDAYRYLAEKYYAGFLQACDAAGSDPVERLKAYVGSAFNPQTLDPDLLLVWTSFWTSAMAAPESDAARVHEDTAKLGQAQLARLLREALTANGRMPDESDIQDVVIAMWSLIDGMWLAWGLNPKLYQPADGRRIAFDILAARLSLPSMSGQC